MKEQKKSGDFREAICKPNFVKTKIYSPIIRKQELRKKLLVICLLLHIRTMSRGTFWIKSFSEKLKCLPDSYSYKWITLSVG